MSEKHDVKDRVCYGCGEIKHGSSKDMERLARKCPTYPGVAHRPEMPSNKK